MQSRWARVARGFTAAGFAVFVAAFSHLSVGGSAPSPFAILVALVISSMLCTLLAGRTRSVWRLLLGVGLSQLLFHGLFSGLGTPAAAPHQMGTATMGAVGTAVHSGGAMWGAHALAAVITVVALRYAGSAFWGLAHTALILSARFTGRPVPVIHTPPPVSAFAGCPFVPRTSTLLLSPMRHRGPPLGIA